MAAARYALINFQGDILNVVVGDDQQNPPWSPPEGMSAVLDVNEEYDIGGTIIDGVYTPPVPPEDPPEE